MKKMVSGLLAILLLFVSGRYVLLEAVKSFFQSSEETGLKSEEYGERQNEGDTETDLDEDTNGYAENEFDEDTQQYDGQETNEEDMSAPWEAITRYGSVTYAIGDVHEGAEVIDDADIQLIDVYVQSELDISPINYQLPGTYQVEAYGINEVERLKVEIIIDVTIVDNIAPVITGDQHASYYVNVPLTVETFLADLLISVEDNSAEYIEPFVDFSSVDFTTAGTYTATVYATDSSGNAAIPFDVQVDLLPAPILRIDIGKPLLTYELGTDITEAMLERDSGLHIEYVRPFTMSSHINMRRLDTSQAGAYTVVVEANDSYGNYESEELTVHIVDTSPPIIEGNTYLGYRLHEFISPTQFILDANILVSDNSAETITPDVDLTNVDFNKPGTYEATITATDSSGNKSKQFIVHIVVGDTSPPIIDVAGEVTYENGTARPSDSQFILDANIVISDNSKERLTPIFDLSTVDFDKPGIYEIEITATDRAGNTSTAVVRVVIADTIAPNITMNNDMLTYEAGTELKEEMIISDAEITVSDNTDEAITPVVDLTTIDMSKAGIYEVGVLAKDAAGNIGSAEVIVTIIDSKAPELEAKKELTYIQGVVRSNEQFMRDAKIVTADDSKAHITPFFSLMSVDFNKVGTYMVHVSAKDASGNTSAANITVHIIQAPETLLTATQTIKHNIKQPLSEALFMQAANIVILQNELTMGVATTPRIDLARVNVHAIGQYTVSVNAVSESGQVVQTINVIVDVIDTEAPLLNGETSLKYGQGSEVNEEQFLEDAKVVASDNSDELILPRVDLSKVNYNEPGTYVAIVSASDASGNTTTMPVNVEISPFAVNIQTNYQDVVRGAQERPLSQAEFLRIIGFRARDENGRDLNASVNTGNVRWNQEGRYTAYVFVTDPATNQVIRRDIPVQIYGGTPRMDVRQGRRDITVEVGENLDYNRLWTSMGIHFGTDIRLKTRNGFVVGQEIINRTGGRADTSKPGDFPGFFWADANNGQTGRSEFVVHVIDTRPPVMDIGSAELEYPVGTPKTPEEVLKDANITITDNSGEEITPEVDLTPVDWDTPGDYEVDVTAKDSSGNTVTNKMKITVYDREPPVIQGPDTHELPIGQPLTEDDIRKLLEVTDNSKADIDPEIDMSKVDTSKPGKYPVEIKAKDPSGNESTKTIEVEVQDKEPPVIDGADKRQYPRGKPLNPEDILKDMGIKVTDNSGEDITPDVDMSQVDTSTPGTYPVDITAEDSSGNKTTKRVEITIPDDGNGGGNNGGGNGGGNNGGGNNGGGNGGGNNGGGNGGGNNGGGNGGGNNGGGNGGGNNGGGNGGAGNNNGGLGGGGGAGGGKGGVGGGPLARAGSDTNVYQYIIGSVLAASSFVIFIRNRRRKEEE